MTIRGTVNTLHEAVVRPRVRHPDGAMAEIDAVVDTGYTGSMTIPDAVATALGLERRSGGRAILADGSSRRFDSYAAEVEWGESWRSVVVSVIGDEPLVGMDLLVGSVLRVEVIVGGVVEVVPIPPPPAAPDPATGSTPGSS